MDDLKKILISESCVPPLKSGEYVMSAYIDSDVLGRSQSAEKTIFIEGPRFSLQPDDVFAVYPPKNEKGSFGTSFPHIIFNRKTLPWERALLEQNNDKSNASPSFETPWLSLLQLWEEEIIDIKSDTVKNAVSAKNKDIYFPELQIKKEEEEEICSYIDIEVSLFKEVFPAYEDLVFLAHARRTNPYYKADNNTGDEWCSVVIGSRVPDSSNKGQKNKVYLVSLEGYGNYTENKKLDDYKYIRLIVLYSWIYESVSEPYHFKEICNELSLGFLSMPSMDDSEKLNSYIENGYVPFIHNIRNGEKTVSFYRGPLTPVNVKSSTDFLPAGSADALYIYDPDVGMFDISYAYAWQIGRMLALSDKTIALKIMKQRTLNRQKIHAAIAKKIMSKWFYEKTANKTDEETNEGVVENVLKILNDNIGGAL